MKNIEDVYPLSPMQQVMLFYSIYAPESKVGFEQSGYILHNELLVAVFMQAWQGVIDRHPILRTFFLWDGLEEPLQLVRKHVKLPWEQQDWRGLPPVEQEERLAALLQEDRTRGFKLSQAPLMRLILIHMTDDTYYFIWSVHHIILDGWSVPLIFKEVFAFYEALSQGRDLSLGHSRLYRDYIAWLQQQNLVKAEEIWRKALKGFHSPTILKIARAPGSDYPQESHGDLHIQLSAASTASLKAEVQRHHLTLNTLIQGVWALLLSHYSGEEDVLFGATVSGRPTTLIGAKSMIGMFINILPVRVSLSLGSSLHSWLKHLQSQQLDLRQYEYCPLLQIQEWSEVPWTLPLFDSLLVFENYPSETGSSLLEHNSRLQIRHVHATLRTNYSLTLVAASGEELTLRLIYDRRRFDNTSATEIADYLRKLLERIAAHPDEFLSDLVEFRRAEHLQLAENSPLPPDSEIHSSVPLLSEDDKRIQTSSFVAPRNTLELQLTQMWEDILQIHPIGVMDNFFSLGGQSLLAMHLSTQIQKRFGQKFPLSLLAQAGSIERMAHFLQQKNMPLSTSPLVALQPHGSKRPFFCVHPGSGNVLCYYNLARHLGRDQPFYGLYDPDVQKEEFPSTPIEDMAAFYINALSTVQSTGPYLLGGYSFGGVVAFEMAQQLQRQGNDVALLAILDSGTPELSNKYIDDATFLAIISMELLRGSIKKNLQELYDDLRSLESHEQLYYVLEQINMAHVEIPGTAMQWIRHQVQIAKTRVRVLQRYKASVYAGQITLFRSSETDDIEHLTLDHQYLLDLGWGNFSTEPIEIHVVPGHHDTLNTEPHVRVLAEHLQGCLERVHVSVPYQSAGSSESSWTIE